MSAFIQPVQKDFDDNADASESYSTDGIDELKYSEDGLNYTSENDDSDPTVAARVKQSNRKRTLPKKIRSPMKTEKKVVTVHENAAIQNDKKKGKKSVLEEVVISQENAAIEYVNSLWVSKEDQYAFKIDKDMMILAKDMAALTHPPCTRDREKYLCIEDNRLMCPGHYSWMFSRALPSDNDTTLSENYLKRIAKEIFSYEMIVDSLQWKPNMYHDHIEKVINGIDFVAKSILNLPDNVSSWEIKPQRTNVPVQTDGYSCGLFAIKYMELWNGTKLRRKFTQKDIPKFRRQMAAELIFSEANEAEVKEGAQKLMNSMDAQE